MATRSSDEARSSTAQSASAWVQTRLADFDRSSLLDKLGQLSSGAAGAGFSRQFVDQTTAWQLELELLEHAVQDLLHRARASRDWVLLLEYTIPRRQRRIDAVLLTPQLICVLEFKIGATAFKRADRWQVEDYVLDLRDFHGGSRAHTIVPFLIATGVDQPPTTAPSTVGSIRLVGRIGLAEIILRAVEEAPPSSASDITSNPEAWVAAPYSPAPTIVEATRTLFQQQSVRELSHAYADNLSVTVEAIADAVRRARAIGHYALCVVTGVPGSGKTLAGLAAVHDPSVRHDADTTAAFLSGNSPLVKVLREALIRDAAPRRGGPRPSEREAEHLVQNVHVFVEHYGVNNPEQQPHEHLVVFDEAQRAWSLVKLDKQQRKRGRSPLGVSEAALVLNVMLNRTRFLGTRSWLG
jgi:hypothetical protein